MARSPTGRPPAVHYVMVRTDVPLKLYCRYRIGGPSRRFLEVRTVEELRAGLAARASLWREDRLFILGAGCNVLVDDCGFDGMVVRNAIRFIEHLPGSRLRVGAGSLMEELLAFCIRAELSGLEWAGGLPGTVGGAVFGNAGAFGGEMKDSLISVESLDLTTLETRTRTGAECEFSYRDSLFKRSRLDECIVAAVFQLEPGSREAIAGTASDRIAYRRERHPLEYPNIGSIFKNVPLALLPAQVLERFAGKIKIDPLPLLPAAVLLSGAGLKGTRLGGIEISPKHPNFFVNVGEGRAAEVRQLIHLAQERVQSCFGVQLEPEIIEP